MPGSQNFETGCGFSGFDGKARRKRRKIGPGSAVIPDPVNAQTLKRHEGDLTRIGPFGNVEHAHSCAMTVGAEVEFVADGADIIITGLALFVPVHVLHVHDEHQIAVGLQVLAPRLPGKID